MHCIDSFKAPYKSILIQLYESSDEFKNKVLTQQIKENFDIKLNQKEIEGLFQKLALDVTLVQPSNIIDLGVLQAKINEKRQNNEEVGMYKEHEIFINKFRQTLEELKNA